MKNFPRKPLTLGETVWHHLSVYFAADNDQNLVPSGVDGSLRVLFRGPGRRESCGEASTGSSCSRRLHPWQTLPLLVERGLARPLIELYPPVGTNYSIALAGMFPQLHTKQCLAYLFSTVRSHVEIRVIFASGRQNIGLVTRYKVQLFPIYSKIAATPWR